MKAVGSLQISAGQDAGAETVANAVETFSDVNTDAVLLSDSENTFNSINHKLMLHNLKFICPIIATYKTNCYVTTSRLFIVGGGEYFLVRGQLKATQQL